MAPRSEQIDFRPFDLLDDGLVLAIFRCFNEPKSLGAVSLVSKRFAELCTEQYIWKPLLHSKLPPLGKGCFAWPPCQGSSWRDRYKQWHTLSSLSWSHCPVPTGAAQPSERFLHRAVAVSDRVYVYGGRGAAAIELCDLWMLRCDTASKSCTTTWERITSTSEHQPIARLSASLSPVSFGEPAHHGLLMFGGRCGETFLNDVWLFDTRTAAWTMLTAHTPDPSDGVRADGSTSVRPDGRWAHSALQHNSSEVVIFGGSSPGLCFNDVFSFSVRTCQWTLHEPTGVSPAPRSGHSVCRVGESMYVFGGNTTEDSFNDLWEYAMDKRAWAQVRTRGAAPSPRVGHVLVPFGDRLMVFGGRKYTDNSFDPALHCYDLQRRRWSDLKVHGEHPQVRTGHAAIPCGSGFLVFGGLGQNGEYFNDTFLLRLWS